MKFDLKNWKSNLSETGTTILTGSIIISGIMGWEANFNSKLIVGKYRKYDGNVN